MKKSWWQQSKLFILSLCFLQSLVWADDTFVVKDIRLDGLARLSAASVFSALPINSGDSVNASKITEAIKALFKTGNFEDVEMARDGDVLVVKLVERPTIVSIDISGNKSIDKDNLLKGLSNAGLSVGGVFQRATFDRVKGELDRQYIMQGRYAAHIDVKMNPKPRNRVALEIVIQEGDAAKIKSIAFVGNKVFSDKVLIENFELRPSHFTSFFSSDDKYSREKLSGDLERLRTFYLDKGYINFTVTSSQVRLSPDKKDVYIELNLTEGEQFKLGEVKLVGDFVVPESVLSKFLLVKKGDIYSQSALTSTSRLISRRLGNDGYIFAEVNPIPDIHEDTKTVDISVFVNPGKLNYVRRINVTGNAKTDNSVIRREFRQLEGSLASGEKIDLSKLRLQRLGFFEDVSIDTPRVPGSTDQVDLNVKVKEQPSGSIGASVGYNTNGGVVYSANVSQSNFLGTGNNFSINLSRADTQDSYSLNFRDPYFTLDGISRGYSLYYKSTKLSSLTVTRYTKDMQGGNINFGYPINENERLGFSIGADNTKINIAPGNSDAVAIVDFVNKYGVIYNNVTANVNWSQNHLNRGVFADKGYSQSVNLDFTVPGSDLTFYKVNYDNQLYIPIASGWAARLHSNFGYGAGYGTTDTLPFYTNYFAGGFGSVRGYQSGRLSPRSPQKNLVDTNQIDPLPQYVGGNVLVEGGAELIFPTPFASDNKQLRTVLFWDVGNAFSTNMSDYKPDVNKLRHSAGVGLSWLTVIGPLSFSYAFPFHNQPDDVTQTFQFTIGQGF